MKTQKWINHNCSRLDGKTICITGSTGGLASKFTLQLASLGASLILANRDKEKSIKQKQTILKKYQNIKIEIMTVDMFDMNSVKLFVCKLKMKNIDILILNSAVYFVPRQTSSYGYDNVFQINFVSPYYIAKQMIPVLRKVKSSKVIVISSIAHNYSKVDFDDIQKLKTNKSNIIYGNSKRLLMFSMQKLFENSHVGLAIVHPGITLTNMTNHYPKAINWLVKIGIKTFFPSPEKACLSVLYGIYNNTQTNEWIGPARKNIWGYPKIQKINTCLDEEQLKIFKYAETIYKKVNNKE